MVDVGKGRMIFAWSVIFSIVFIIVFALAGGFNSNSDDDPDGSDIRQRPSSMMISMWNECEYTIHVIVWVDNTLVCNDYIGTGFWDSPAWVNPSASNSRISVKFCIAEYGYWSDVWELPRIYNNGDKVDIEFYPDLTMRAKTTTWQP